MKQLYALLFSLFFLASCQFPERYFERQDYDAAFQFAYRRLDGKRQKTKHLQTLERAFRAASERDLAKVDSLRQKDTRQAWQQIYYLHETMRSRQEKLREIQPLASEEGFRPYVKTYPVEDWVEESYGEMVDYFLRDIRSLLASVQMGNKKPAREAHQLLVELDEQYLWSEPVWQNLVDSCFLLGTEHIYLSIGGNPNREGIDWVANWLNEWEMKFEHDWKKLHRWKNPEVNYDYLAHLEVTETYVSQENVSVVSTNVSEEVEVGKKEIWDTAGNVTYEPILCTVHATIRETSITKDASVVAWLTVKNAHTGEWMEEKKVQGNSWFSDSACDFFGDKRAVNVICCGGIFASLDAFPSDRRMLRNATSGLKGKVLRELERMGE